MYAGFEASGSLQVRELSYMMIMHASHHQDVKSAEILKPAFRGYFIQDTIEKEPFGVSKDFFIVATFCSALCVLIYMVC